LSGIKVAAASEMLLKAAADQVSTVKLSLTTGSTLKGAVNAANTAKSVSVTLDATSTRTLTGDSHVTSLAGAKISGSTVTNVVGNGHKLTYDASNYLAGTTYTLAGGGTLSPA